jgi:hypothetical protein
MKAHWSGHGGGQTQGEFADLALYVFEVCVTGPPANFHDDGVVDTIDCKVDGSAGSEAVRSNAGYVVAGSNEIVANSTAAKHGCNIARGSMHWASGSGNERA